MLTRSGVGGLALPPAMPVSLTYGQGSSDYKKFSCHKGCLLYELYKAQKQAKPINGEKDRDYL